ncbi:MAG: hypothetical protein QN183_10205 [Armatimonadota bacterium]|nr:hypothetical protein [Armatimonadota bacterium]MDR7486381.1 hypothetical protein [Armatimonadota bacterium]MDR7532137.1 hypothetical protein [Armatimonadota bacterium]MDR7536725.1 hypothetical protein [Armatimonadota bacterium]
MPGATMLWDIGRWVVTGLLLLLFASVALFEVLNLPPDDPLFQMMGNPAWVKDLRAIRQAADSRQPYWKQYLVWLSRFTTYLWGRLRRVSLPADAARHAGTARAARAFAGAFAPTSRA